MMPFLSATRSSLAGLVACALVICVSTSVFAVEPGEKLKDAALEARARQLSAGLRCLVCQNQSIDDSNAPLARDLRLLVRERLSQGDTDDAVLRFIVERYGNFVLLRPPVSPTTIALWLTPLFLLALGGIVVVRASRRSIVAAPITHELSEDERKRLDKLLRDPT